MAKMIPPQFPPEAAKKPELDAERQFYERCAEQLSNDWIVWYSVKWVAKDGRRRARDGEADFVLAHPALGVLVVEVKGGKIASDGETRKWASVSRGGYRNEIKDPFSQAEASKHSLLQKMQGVRSWNPSWVELGHAVAFPHCGRPDHPLAPHAPHELVAYAADLNRIEAWAKGVNAYWRHMNHAPTALGAEGIAALETVLSPVFQLATPLMLTLDRAERRIIELSKQQTDLLEFLKAHRRVSIHGGAGTGKTVLGVCVTGGPRGLFLFVAGRG